MQPSSCTGQPPKLWPNLLDHYTLSYGEQTNNSLVRLNG